MHYRTEADFSVLIRDEQKSHRFAEHRTPIGDDTPKFNLNNSIARVSLACRASEGISMARNVGQIVRRGARTVTVIGPRSGALNVRTCSTPKQDTLVLGRSPSAVGSQADY